MLGLWVGQHADLQHPSRRSLPWAIVGLVALCAGWPSLVRTAEVTAGFPFMRVHFGGIGTTILMTSVLVELIYCLSTWVVHRVSLHLPDWAIVRFFARNTLFIFVAHMPLIYALSPVLDTVPLVAPLRLLRNVSSTTCCLACWEK